MTTDNSCAAAPPPLDTEHYLPQEGHVVTIQQHILQKQKRFPGASGEFSLLLNGITLATKMIQAKVRQAGLNDLLGEHGEVNVQGEVQQKLDVYANDMLLHCLASRQSIGILASEENEHPLTVPHGSPNSKYAVIFDPLDGSSNIDVAVSVGTTFSILCRPDGADRDDVTSWVLQPGAAGGGRLRRLRLLDCHGLQRRPRRAWLHARSGDRRLFCSTHENIRIPAQGKYYSVNEANRDTFAQPYRDYLDLLRGGGLGQRYGSRYVGSMVADVHRTLLKGGVFLYPPTIEYPSGKLRLLYEANPIAFLIEQAGGMATDGRGRVLDIQPQSIHQRTPLAIGGRVEIEQLQRMLDKS